MPRPTFVAAGTLILLGLSCREANADSAPTLESNFEFRQSSGELGTPVVVPPTPATKRTIQITGDTDTLLRLCENSPNWRRDPIIFRLAHLHPTTSIGCREKASPSLHAMFYTTPTGDRETWVHFDLYGPQNPMVHLTEVIRNRMSFGKTSQNEVYRGLVRAQVRLLPDDQQASLVVPESNYDLKAHARQYVRSVIGPGAFGNAFATVAASVVIHRVNGDPTKGGRIAQHLSRQFVRNGVWQSIEFGTAAFLQQDQTFRASGEQGTWKRSRIALYRTLFVPGRQGDELAFPRIAASLGTPLVMRQFHPGVAGVPNPLVQSAIMMGRYAILSYWAEFKPDVLEKLKRTFHLDH